MRKKTKKGSDIIDLIIIFFAICVIATFIGWFVYHGVYKSDDLDIAITYQKLTLQKQ